MDIDKLKTWLESEDAEKFFEKERLEVEIQEGRYKRFETWLENNDFDKLMSRLILEHNDEYIDKCYHNGFMPFPNRKLAFVIGYVCDNLASINVTELDCNFPNQIWQFKGYYFQHIHGQGTIVRIYNKDDLRQLLQL